MPKGLLYRLKFLECLWNSFLKMLLDHLNPSFFKKQNKTKQNKTKQTKQNKAKQSKTKQNKAKQSKTKQKENRGVTTLIELKYGLAILS